MRDIKKSEEKLLRAWKRNDTFRNSVAQRVGKPRFVFYDGPPTANGRPGIHHVMILSMKDVFLRYKTMRGFLVERRAGWDTHGLPVELEVEKELGFTDKADIEKYGIAKFNARAKKSVWKYKKEWEQLQERIGFWINHDHPYITYENAYMESVWWALKSAHNKGLLQEDYKVVPYCPRCGTALASHEVSQGYENVHDRSITAAFRVKGEKNVAILAWTTTPWTLPGNVALAVGKDITYAEVFVPEEGMTYVLAKDAIERVMGERTYEVRGELSGENLIGIEYEPLFAISETKNEKSHKVYAADFVNTEDGTGVVHTAVMYGEEDYRLGEEIGLPKVHTVLENGTFTDFVPDNLAGKFVKADETEKAIIEALTSRGLLFNEARYEHEYPFCWRCKTPLLYYARTSWYIRMSRLRNQLLQENDKINWVPHHLQDGRFGEWLREVKDWAVSRERYWGTPLPIWRCDETADHIEVMGGTEELARRVGFKNKYILVRHGEAESNVRHLLSSDPKHENPLTAKGREQAQSVAETLKEIGIDVLVTSDLMRTHQTAGIISKELGLELVVEKRLREINFGEYHDKTLEEYQAHFEQDAQIAYSKKPKGGEHWGDVRSRMMKVLQSLEEQYVGKTIVLVSHSGPMFILEIAVRGLPESALFNGSLEEMQNGIPRDLRGGMLPTDTNGSLDLHRPFIDDISFACEQGDGVMRRVKEVADVWLDSACMPFAQWHYPFENRDLVENEWYPADLILEGIDQTRGWFYTLHATAVFLGWERAYRNVVSTGHVLDKRGKKMSKSRGNAADPWEMIEKFGADAIRWYFFTVNQPSDPKRFDEKDIKTVLNRMLGTLTNTYTFLETYGAKSAWKKLGGDVPQAQTVLDRWVLSRLQATLATTAERMDAYDLTEAARTMEAFVIGDLSNWYVRRSRDRFQRPGSKDAHMAVTQLLAYVLVQVSRAMAPFTPFLADEIYQAITKEPSVHLATYPEPSAPLRDEVLEAQMEQVRDAVAEGLAVRKKQRIAVRQPLGAVALGEEFDAVLESGELGELVMNELNVKRVVSLDIGTHEDWYQNNEEQNHNVRLDPQITDDLRLEGNVRELRRIVQGMRKEGGLVPSDKIVLSVAGLGATTMAFKEAVKSDPDVLRVKKLETEKKEREYLVESEADIDDEQIWIGISK